jgi:ubiquinone/menaquinone biosynthesis C-methylase UbiE
MKSATLEQERLESKILTKTADFSRLARIYRWMEWATFGPLLWRCRCAFLGEMQDRRTALILGDGDGRFTARLLNTNSQIKIEAIDASSAMLHQLLVRSARHIDRVNARMADARRPFFLSSKFDLVVTHFFLDCLSSLEVESLALEISQRLEPGAVWIVSEFAIPENLYGRLVASPLVSALYLAFSLLTGLTVRSLPQYDAALEKAGFVLTQQKKRLFGLLVSQMWQAPNAARSCPTPFAAIDR